MAITRLIPAGDLDLTPSGDLLVISGSEEVRQRIFLRLKFFKSEWFRDLREGMPYYQAVLVAAPNLELVRSVFRKAILGTPGVLALPELNLSIDSVARTLSVTFKAKTSNADIVVSTAKPFVIEL